MTKKSVDVTQITYIALFTAIVAVLQGGLGGAIQFGIFNVTVVLLPIVVGAALCGKWAGAWLGFVFSLIVLIAQQATFFLQMNIFGTIITVILKGTLAGFSAGIAYDLLKKINRFVAVMTASIISPIVNTGVYLLGCRLFFFDYIKAGASEKGVSTFGYVILFAVGFNFIFELLINVVLAPVAVRLIDMKNPSNK